MADAPLPPPHLEIERADGLGEPWKWSIYAGQGGPRIQASEDRYPSPDAARRVGDKAVFAIQVRASSNAAKPERL